MLHDPSHYEAPIQAEEIVLPKKEKEILRRLGSQLAEIAALPVHQEKAQLWQKLNDLQSERPMVWINEIPWHEMNINDELTLQTEHPWAQEQERELRRTIFQWNHFPGDMVVNNFYAVPLAVHSTDFGIIEDVELARTDEDSDIVSRHFNVQIENLDDLEKIKMPVISHNEQATEYRYQAALDVFGDLMPVKKQGQTHIWFTPWDYLIRWTGIENAMLMMYEDPDLVHAAVDRMVDAWMAELDQFVDQNLLALDCNNTRIGSGGYGFTDQLPGRDFNPEHVKPHNMWGCSNAQIFSEVSPEFHWEFAVKHDMRWLERWGMTYYGCCEPLAGKMDVLRKINNLRKISVSPWCKTAQAIEEIGADYVMSRKPNPAILAEDKWHPERARKEIRDFLEAAGGQCHIELIMKDISTVRYQPQRLREWSQIAMEEAERYSCR